MGLKVWTNDVRRRTMTGGAVLIHRERHFNLGLELVKHGKQSDIT